MADASIAEVIDTLGGTREAARRLNLAPSTVDGWIRRNKIPRWWYDLVASEVRKANKANGRPRKGRAA